MPVQPKVPQLHAVKQSPSLVGEEHVGRQVTVGSGAHSAEQEALHPDDPGDTDSGLYSVAVRRWL